ncbi:MAG: hypothetical protein M5U16_09420 [Hyphomicrobium sp.]|nr:hypothetical protein [Hyphomicrobium sp.]
MLQGRGPGTESKAALGALSEARPHSLIAASIRFAGRSQNEVIVEIEAVCAALAVLPEPYDPLTDCGRIHIPYRNGEMSYDRVLDNRITPFKVEDAIWFRIFVQTDAVYQLARRRDFA